MRGDHEPAVDDLQSLQLSCSKQLFSPDLCRDIPEWIRNERNRTHQIKNKAVVQHVDEAITLAQQIEAVANGREGDIGNDNAFALFHNKRGTFQLSVRGSVRKCSAKTSYRRSLGSRFLKFKPEYTANHLRHSSISAWLLRKHRA